MNWKTIIIVCGIIIFVAAIGAGIYVFTRPTESMRGLQINFEFTPKQTFGCANYNIPKDFSIKTDKTPSVQKLNK